MINFGNNIEGSREIFNISRRKMTQHHGKHVHGFFEILYLSSGERCFFINDRTFTMKEGDLIFIQPNILHRATSEGYPDCEGVLLYFHEQFLDSGRSLSSILTNLFANENIYIQLSLSERARVEELFSQMLQEFQQKQTGYTLALQSLSLQLLIFLCRYLESHQAVAVEHPSPMHEKVSEIARYINAHYSEDLSLELLAQQFYISPSYLSKVFKRVTNFTFVEYLNNVRVKEAKRLLMESRKKIIGIAEEVGFGSITHFGRVFKEITGNPPMYYRKLKK
jgi:YesN/AraC family two-component response regulator